MDIEKAKNILNHYLEMEEFDSAGDFLIAIDTVLSELEKSKLGYTGNHIPIID